MSEEFKLVIVTSVAIVALWIAALAAIVFIAFHFLGKVW